MVNEYIKTLQATAGTPAGPSNGNITIELDTDGFPIVPRPPSWDKITKEELEKLYRTYITQHYRMFISDMPALSY